jgi:hypothetical protein
MDAAGEDDAAVTHVFSNDNLYQLRIGVIPKPRVTGDLRRWLHKNKLVHGFTSGYHPTRVAYYQCFLYPDERLTPKTDTGTT